MKNVFSKKAGDFSRCSFTHRYYPDILEEMVKAYKDYGVFVSFCWLFC